MSFFWKQTLFLDSEKKTNKNKIIRVRIDFSLFFCILKKRSLSFGKDSEWPIK